MSSAVSPLLDNEPIDDPENKWNNARKASLWCHPIALIAVLALVVIAFVYPFWDNETTQSLTSSHPLIKTEQSALHANNKKFLTVEALTDQVQVLPGLEDDNLNFNHYSGYVDANDGHQIHYWFFEAQNDPDTAPLFFWTNGGPGCSGLCGLLTEHGPIWAVDDNQLMVNEYSWNTEVNIVYFEQPYGVGFSTVDEDEQEVTGDATAVADFAAAVRSFISKFPSFEGRDTYLSSESFGGHYMPLTALEIMKNNEAGLEPHVNFKGFMVGNPYTNYYENTIGSMEAFYGHGLMREDVYETWKEYCFGDETAMDNTHCRYLYVIGYYEAENTDNYALDFDYCINDISWQKHKKHLLFHTKFINRAVNRLLSRFESDAEWDSYSDSTMRPLFENRKSNKHKKRKGKMRLPSRRDIQRLKARIDGTYKDEEERRRLNIEWGYDDLKYYPCAADLMTNYLNQEIVQQALHVKTPTDWEMCNDDIFRSWPETDWDNKMEPYYAELAAKYPHLKILVFSGDDDSVCGLHGTQYWLDNMDTYGWTVDSDNEWLPWQYEQQLAGYSTTYLTKNGDVALYFHTVRTAGHMVPQTQPQRALGLLRKFLNEME